MTHISERIAPNKRATLLSDRLSTVCMFSPLLILGSILDLVYSPVEKRISELPTPCAVLIFLYVGSFALHTCFYIRGILFKFALPKSDARDDHLICIKENIRAWTQYTAHFWEREKGFEKRVFRCQEAFAWYLAAPWARESTGTEYWCSSNLGSVALTFWLHYILGRCSYIVAHGIFFGGNMARFAVVLEVGVALAWLNLQSKLMSGFLYSNAERFGRELRMSALAENIRGELIDIQGDMERAETTKEKLVWWIENLVPSTEEEKIKSMIKRSEF